MKYHLYPNMMEMLDLLQGTLYMGKFSNEGSWWEAHHSHCSSSSSHFVGWLPHGFHHLTVLLRKKPLLLSPILPISRRGQVVLQGLICPSMHS